MLNPYKICRLIKPTSTEQLKAVFGFVCQADGLSVRHLIHFRHFYTPADPHLTASYQTLFYISPPPLWQHGAREFYSFFPFSYPATWPWVEIVWEHFFLGLLTFLLTLDSNNSRIRIWQFASPLRLNSLEAFTWNLIFFMIMEPNSMERFLLCN